MDNENKAKNLADKLSYKRKSAYEIINETEAGECFDFCKGYIDFLNRVKTERDCVKFSKSMAQKNGFVQFNKDNKLNPGDKFYHIHRNKAIILGIMGQAPVSEGINIVMAHIDAPRIDLKPNPLYEEGGMALLKTHYYGGIKKYQWTAIPLCLCGVVTKSDGTKIDISIGQQPGEPVFCITDLLPHLAADQMNQKLGEAIKGEGLNILVGSRPFDSSDESLKIKLNILNILNEKYNIVEKDLLCADLEAVPAFPAKDAGLDLSMVGSYGQDDRVCAYTSLMAAIETVAPKKTSLCILVDREEIGSMGNTGAQSRFIEYFIADLGDMQNTQVRHILSKSTALSADVNLAYDPNYPDVSEKNNTAFLNFGVAISKYTGSRGKSGTSEASSELVASICSLFDANGVCWQMGELGKVDQGGGGTVAQYIANLDLEVLDCGVPVLSMHSPFEITGKADIYMAYKGYKAFFQKF